MPQETGEQLDIEEYDHVVFRVHGDGRKYIANLRTENWLVGGPSHDVWQAFLFARYVCCCCASDGVLRRAYKVFKPTGV